MALAEYLISKLVTWLKNFHSVKILKILILNSPFASINFSGNFCLLDSFARDEKYMFTIQNPINSSGASYLTRWKLEDNFDPEKTITLHKKAVTASCFKYIVVLIASF
jgi:hypothetical protein